MVLSQLSSMCGFGANCRYFIIFLKYNTYFNKPNTYRHFYHSNFSPSLSLSSKDSLNSLSTLNNINLQKTHIWSNFSANLNYKRLVFHLYIFHRSIIFCSKNYIKRWIFEFIETIPLYGENTEQLQLLRVLHTEQHGNFVNNSWSNLCCWIIWALCKPRPIHGLGA